MFKNILIFYNYKYLCVARYLHNIWLINKIKINALLNYDFKYFKLINIFIITLMMYWNNMKKISIIFKTQEHALIYKI